MASAAIITSEGFRYDGGTIALDAGSSRTDTVIAAWNPRATGENSSPRAHGFHVSFFGHGAGCPSDASNGPVVPITADMASRERDLTGVAAGGREGDHSWTPASDPAACGYGANPKPGPAFVLANEGRQGGIALYTLTGDSKPDAGFWHEFASEGQNGKGANAGIEGTFISWVFDWQHGNSASPWMGQGGGSREAPSIKIRTVQSAPTVVSPQSPPGVRPTQVNQHFGATLVSRSCLTLSRGPACQVRYLFHAALARGGIADWSRETWANHAHLLLDPAQNGLPVIAGPLRPSGEATDVGGRLELWQSIGAETQHGPFGQTTFGAKISFQQFENGLKLVAGKLLSRPPAAVTENDLAGVFGAAWQDPSNWLLTDVNVGQEVHNLNPRDPAAIGGSVMRFEVSSK